MTETTTNTSTFPAGGAPSEPGMSRVVQRNIAALVEVRRREKRCRSLADRLADGVTAFAGSIWGACAHASFYGTWLVSNAGWVPGVTPWDPFPFVMLAMFASVEAIFLSTFILISQNRMSEAADRRAELDLQISLLAEHELTRVVQMLDSIASQQGSSRPPPHEIEDIKRDINPTKVAQEIERAQAATGGAERPGDDAVHNANHGDPS